MGITNSSRKMGDRERGAAAFIVAAALVALFGSAAIAVDLGNARLASSRTVTAADAGALAASQSLAAGSSEITACVDAAAVVSANASTAIMEICETGVATSGTPIVTVVVSEPVDYVFAPVLGFSSTTVSSRSSARFGSEGVSGARPFGICMEALQADLAGWDPVGSTPIGPIIVPYGKGAQPAACNGGDPVPGNWGSLDFDGGSNSNNDQKDWIENGYPGTLYPPEIIEGNPGAMAGSVASALQSLVDSGEVFAVPLFDQATGNGANAEFNVIGFVRAQLTDYKVNGNAAGRYIEMIFHPGLYPGVPCCDPSGTSVVLRNTGLCAVSEETGAC